MDCFDSSYNHLEGTFFEDLLSTGHRNRGKEVDVYNMPYCTDPYRSYDCLGTKIEGCFLGLLIKGDSFMLSC